MQQVGDEAAGDEGAPAGDERVAGELLAGRREGDGDDLGVEGERPVDGQQAHVVVDGQGLVVLVLDDAADAAELLGAVVAAQAVLAGHDLQVGGAVAAAAVGRRDDGVLK